MTATTGPNGLAAVNFISATQTGTATVTASAGGSSSVSFTVHAVPVPAGWTGGGTGSGADSTPPRSTAESADELAGALAEGYLIRVQKKSHDGPDFPSLSADTSTPRYLGAVENPVVLGGYEAEDASGPASSWSRHAKLTFEPLPKIQYGGFSMPWSTLWAAWPKPDPRLYLVRLYKGEHVEVDLNAPDSTWVPVNTSILSFSYTDTGAQHISLAAGIPPEFIKVEGNTVVMTPEPPGGEDGRYWMVLTRLAIEINWEAKLEFANIDDNPDPWKNKHIGKRIFPDNTEDDPEGGMRRELNVKVAVPDYANKTVYLKVFDPDDPSTIDDPGRVLDPNGDGGGDNIIGATLTEPFGWFLPQAAHEVALPLDSDGNGQVEFIVNQQPGNNYRVALALEQADLASLQVANPTGEGFVTSDDNQVAGFKGRLSPLLTVWRKLHMEVDSMAAGPLPENKEAPDRVVVTGHHWETGYLGWDALHLTPHLTEEINFYGGGYVKAGNISLRIFLSGDETVTIDGRYHGLLTILQKTSFIGPVEIFDDDDLWLTKTALPNWELITSGVKKTYSKAYINIVKRAGNPRQSIPFEQYSSYGFFSNLDDAGDFGDDSEGFWSHCIISAYQPPKDEANDPITGGGGKEGTTNWFLLPWFEYSVVFLEVIRDKWVQASEENNPQSLQARIDMVVSHEIGHEPGHKSEPVVHKEEGLMNSMNQTEEFSAESLRRIRKTPRWKAAW